MFHENGPDHVYKAQPVLSPELLEVSMKCRLSTEKFTDGSEVISGFTEDNKSILLINKGGVLTCSINGEKLIDEIRIRELWEKYKSIVEFQDFRKQSQAFAH